MEPTKASVKIKPRLGCKSKTNNTVNGQENGVGVGGCVNHSNCLSEPPCKQYKSNGDIDKSNSTISVNGSCVDNVSAVKEIRLQEQANGTQDNMAITDEYVRNTAFKWCQDCLEGSWTQLASKEDIVIAPISGGTSNYLYLISLPSSHPPKGSEPNEVVFRIYGEMAKTTEDCLIQNSIVFVLLAEKKLGPKPYGIYHDGRIEEFIKAEALSHYDLRRPEIMSLVSEKMALFHKLSMPLCKKPMWFEDYVRRWLDQVLENAMQLERPMAQLNKLCPSVNLSKEYDLLIKVASDMNAPSVFCHNDFQSGNLLYQPATANKPADLVVIDTEYACYEHRGSDLANHFIEWSYDLTVGGMPGFIWYPERFPTKEQQFAFFKSYLDALGDTDYTDQTLETLYKESMHFVLHSHFKWACWSMLQLLSSSIEFDFEAYGLCRFEAYFRHKSLLETMYGPLG